MISLESISSDLAFTLANLTWAQAIDLALVTFVFYTLLSLLRRSRSTVLLRGTLIVILFFFIFSVFLPLPIFDYLIQVALVAILVAIPIIFQPELRYLLEELGRTVGNLNWQQRAAEVTLKPLVRAIESLSTQKVGALIVLEGEDDLSGILETGVPLNSEVTSELLQTIFYDGTPLHDGALIIRGEKVMAAGCVLPVSNRQLYAKQRRLGTRHRAAVGLTETSDALVLVVSEETGQVSTARHGELQTDVDKTVVREQIHSFYHSGESETSPDFSWQRLFARVRDLWMDNTDHAGSRRLLSNLGLLILSLLFALSTWAFVLEQTNAVQERTIPGIPLHVTDIPPGTSLLDSPPETVTAVVRATDEVLPSLDPGSFDARVSLAGLSPDLHRLNVNVDPTVSHVQVVSVRPSELDLRLDQIITNTVPVQAVVVGTGSLSPAFEVRDAPEAQPAEVQVTGAATRVEQVARAEAEISVAEASGLVQQSRSVAAVTEGGSPVADVTVQPEQVQVSVLVAHRQDARDVGVRVVTEGQLPDDYRLSQFFVSPAQVTLLGDPEALAAVGNAVPTLPVDLANAADNLRIQVPLDLPPGVDAVDTYGNTVRSVLVQMEVTERQGNRVITRTVRIQGETGLDLTITPRQVDITLTGPVPLLDDIQAQPDLVQVFIDTSSLADLVSGQTLTISPQVSKPEQITAALVPKEVQVRAR